MGILIRYFLNSKEYASRTRTHVPRVGDFVRFKGVCYSILTVVWIEDEGRDYIAIDIKKEPQI